MSLSKLCRGAQGLSSFCFWLFFVFFLIFFHSAVEAQPGFLSLDCGLPEGERYVDNITGIVYVPDGQYVGVGEPKTVQGSWLPRRYETLRAFPEGVRNCYTLRALQVGGKHIIRAGFFYGDYDGLRTPPDFEFHVGAHSRIRIPLQLNATVTEEVIAVANDYPIWVCLVNTGLGTPVISTLQLRLLPALSYSPANASQSLHLKQRVNYGATATLRYPSDRYDRLWNIALWSFTTINTTMTVKSNLEGSFPVPSAVLQTAIAAPNVSYPIILQAVYGVPTDTVYVLLHFAELQNLSRSNKKRVMDIFASGLVTASLTNFTPPFLSAYHIHADDKVIGPTSIFNVTIQASDTSTLPPMINAMESFIVYKADEQPTNIADVLAVEDIKSAYELKRNWQGDPCIPREYLWNGVECAYYNNTKATRIISLDLSSSGLTTEIPDAISNLTALQTLDVSNNSIPITVSALLAKLPSSLELLKLSGNKIEGVPADLCGKLAGGNITTRIEGLEAVCSSASPPQSKSGSSSFKQDFHVFGAVFLALLGFI